MTEGYTVVQHNKVFLVVRLVKNAQPGLSHQVMCACVEELEAWVICRALVEQRES